jgi:hypothetical protein
MAPVNAYRLTNGSLDPRRWHRTSPVHLPLLDGVAQVDRHADAHQVDDDHVGGRGPRLTLAQARKVTAGIKVPPAVLFAIRLNG